MIGTDRDRDGGGVPRAIVCGGSLGGLTAALVLRDAGCEVEVYERAPRPLSGRGVGIVAHPATIRYPVERGGTDPTSPVRVLRYLAPDGSIVHEEPSDFRFTSYYSLYRALLDLLGADRYHLGHEVTGFEQDADAVTVELADGRRERGELLVCADGIQSGARRRLLPEVEHVYSGYVGWRGAVPEAELGPDALAALDDALVYCLIPNSHILTYPIPSVADGAEAEGRTINWVWYRNVEEGSELDELLTDSQGRRQEISLPPGGVRPAAVEELRGHADRVLAPQLAELVRATAEPFVQVVFDIAVPRMAFGRVCLIGDAASALRPHIAAGTAKAAEAAWMLADSLRAAEGDVVEALRSWEPRALELERQALERTRAAGNRVQHENAMRVGEPIPFGLYETGDSAIPSRDQRHPSS
jgi:2,6-dihydroxypyridine 3-monooxygenase